MDLIFAPSGAVTTLAEARFVVDWEPGCDIVRVRNLSEVPLGGPQGAVGRGGDLFTRFGAPVLVGGRRFGFRRQP